MASKLEVASISLASMVWGKFSRYLKLSAVIGVIGGAFVGARDAITTSDMPAPEDYAQEIFKMTWVNCVDPFANRIAKVFQISPSLTRNSFRAATLPVAVTAAGVGTLTWGITKAIIDTKNSGEARSDLEPVRGTMTGKFQQALKPTTKTLG